MHVVASHFPMSLGVQVADRGLLQHIASHHVDKPSCTDLVDDVEERSLLSLREHSDFIEPSALQPSDGGEGRGIRATTLEVWF